MQNKQSVLVIDDSPTVRRLAELVLSEQGYYVLTAEDGDNGLRTAREKVPSLIIVDFIMPKMNGFQFCKNVRTDPALRDVPIVLITSKGKDVGKGFDSKFGIVKYLQKPFETETLTNIVSEVLAERKNGAQPESADSPAEEVPAYATAAAGSQSQLNAQAETGQGDTPSVEVPHALPEVTTHDIAAYKGTPVHNPLGTAPSAEGDAFEKVLPEPDHSSPQEKGPSRSGDAVPFHVAIQENIEKEFRNYFGQELAFILKNTVVQTLKETDLVRSSRRILSGEITYISPADLLSLVNTSGLSGKLSVTTDHFNSDIYIESGKIAFAAISRTGSASGLEQLLFRNGRPMKKEILAALSEARGNSLAAGRILLNKGLISRDELTEYYRRLSKEAVQQTLEAKSGSFYIEDIPLPEGLINIDLEVPLEGRNK